MWSVPEARNLALKAEMMEKVKKPFYSYNVDSGRHTLEPDWIDILFKSRESSKTLEKVGNPNQNQKFEPYAKHIVHICHRCKKPDHCSNVCPERKKVNLVENEEEDDKEENIEDDDYCGVEFTIENGLENVTLVLQRVMLVPRQRHNIFRSSCSMNSKPCEVIIHR